jgi:hypothetical protein
MLPLGEAIRSRKGLITIWLLVTAAPGEGAPAGGGPAAGILFSLHLSSDSSDYHPHLLLFELSTADYIRRR